MAGGPNCLSIKKVALIIFVVQFNNLISMSTNKISGIRQIYKGIYVYLIIKE